ncbi:hypothetical protein J2790_000278 [Paenarthrobacter nicotinovorans]|uniref:DUF2690 domain-containing protein n=1 Tax=Micrococcaceae TaxID=1268 RepID=UPI0008762671|nr:hypothetical protein [Paenarthrobacter nicotinovorans]SCZ49102.1 Protein of unknown function [Arthrobacter sp. UNCCL28]
MANVLSKSMKLGIKMLRKIAATTAAVASMVAFGLMASPVANASPAHENTDPNATGCASGAYAITSRNVVNTTYNQVQGRVDVMYSPACQTNWVNLYGFVAGNRYQADIQNLGFPVLSVGTVFFGAGSGYSRQTYSPGGSCIDVSWQIRDAGSLALEGADWMRLC